MEIIRNLLLYTPGALDQGAESDNDKNLAGGRESGVALHKRDREDDAELAVSHTPALPLWSSPGLMILHLLRVLDIAPT